MTTILKSRPKIDTLPGQIVIMTRDCGPGWEMGALCLAVEYRADTGEFRLLNPRGELGWVWQGHTGWISEEV